MPAHIERAQKLAQDFFGLELPLDARILKKVYRQACHILHPDKKGGDDRAFKAMQNAYDFLMSLQGMGFGIFGQKQDVGTPTRRKPSRVRHEQGMGPGVYVVEARANFVPPFPDTASPRLRREK